MSTEMQRDNKMGKGLTIEFDREVDGRWIAEIPELPGCVVYGFTQKEAERNAIVLAYRSILLDIEYGEEVPKYLLNHLLSVIKNRKIEI